MSIKLIRTPSVFRWTRMICHCLSRLPSKSSDTRPLYSVTHQSLLRLDSVVPFRQTEVRRHWGLNTEGQSPSLYRETPRQTISFRKILVCEVPTYPENTYLSRLGRRNSNQETKGRRGLPLLPYTKPSLIPGRVWKVRDLWKTMMTRWPVYLVSIFFLT